MGSNIDDNARREAAASTAMKLLSLLGEGDGDESSDDEWNDRYTAAGQSALMTNNILYNLLNS